MKLLKNLFVPDRGGGAVHTGIAKKIKVPVQTFYLKFTKKLIPEKQGGRGVNAIWTGSR